MGINVLIIDDSGVMRAMVLKCLRMSGVPLDAAHQAANGEEGLEMLERHSIDLIIADINMPVMTGEQMLEKVRQSPLWRDMPVIVISTESGDVRTEKLKKLGAAFIHKPFTPETVRDTVKRVIKSKILTEARTDGP